MTPGDILISESDIAHAIPEIVHEIIDDYADSPPLLVGVMDGAVCFLADLIRAFPVSVEVATARVSSYNGAVADDAVVVWLPPSELVAGRDVLLVEDIVDTGATVALLVDRLTAIGAASVNICALLDKSARRVLDVEVAYAGFDVPDIFVVGYGLDYNGAYRNLPDVRELEAR